MVYFTVSVNKGRYTDQQTLARRHAAYVPTKEERRTVTGQGARARGGGWGGTPTNTICLRRPSELKSEPIVQDFWGHELVSLGYAKRAQILIESAGSNPNLALPRVSETPSQ